jgi:DNA-binding LytR/AlgR family response regulator
MLTYSCIIIEDEPLAIEIMQDYIQQIPFLALKGICTDAIAALEILNTTRIDLIFLDLHLPKLKGFDFLNVLGNRPKIIITTAYHEYALKSYEYDVVDYLLKPIEFNRFLTAVNKLSAIDQERKDPSVGFSSDRTTFFFNVGKKKVKVYEDEILLVESQKEYIKIVTASKTLLTKFQLTALEELLSPQQFIRVHRSFIVAKNKIEAYNQNEIDIAGKVIPIGRNYKELVQSKIG